MLDKAGRNSLCWNHYECIKNNNRCRFYCTEPHKGTC